jgi:hypothetical protein
MTEKQREVANPWRAGCPERGTSGSEGGVRKRAEEQRALPLPYQEGWMLIAQGRVEEGITMMR